MLRLATRGCWQRIPRGLRRGAPLALLLAAAAAPEQQDAGVSSLDVVVEVVHATPKETSVDPSSLRFMRRQFSKQGMGFTGFHRLAEHHLTLVQGRAVELPLPNRRVTFLTLQEVTPPTARVAIGPHKEEVTYTLSEDGSVFVDVGSFQRGRIFLILSSAKYFRSRENLAAAPDGGQ